MFQKLESLHPTLNNIESQTASIQNTLLHNIDELQALHRDATKAALVQHQQQEEMCGGLKTLHAQTSGQHEAVMCKLNVLVWYTCSLDIPCTKQTIVVWSLNSPSSYHTTLSSS
jgi:hypothetical protein